MEPTNVTSCTAFAGTDRVASGQLRDVAGAVRGLLDREPNALVLVFDDANAHQVEIDVRGTVADVLARYPAPEPDKAAEAEGQPEQPRGPGRPKLGVVPREVTLMPRHWEWLATQRGGASAALRRLVDEARHANADADRERRARDVAYRFMVSIGGDLPGFEEVSRALFAGDAHRFDELVAEWPDDVRDYTRMLAADGLS